MTALVILALVSTAVLTYAVGHALRHDPRRPDLTPRSHHDDAPPAPWYDHTTAA